jgi:hypothetical protein
VGGSDFDRLVGVITHQWVTKESVFFCRHCNMKTVYVRLCGRRRGVNNFEQVWK